MKMFSVFILTLICGVVDVYSAHSVAYFPPVFLGNPQVVNFEKNFLQTAKLINSLSEAQYMPSFKYDGPIALPPGYDKYGAPLPVEDTPEVAQAKILHLVALVRAGGTIHPSLEPDQSPIETPEEQAASKYVHEAAVNKAKEEISNAINELTQEIGKHPPTPKYLGPIAEPQVSMFEVALPMLDTSKVNLPREKQLSYAGLNTQSIIHYQKGGPSNYITETSKDSKTEAEKSWSLSDYSSEPIALPSAIRINFPTKNMQELVKQKDNHRFAYIKIVPNVY